MITPFFKERSGREGMTVVSVLLGAAVEVGVGSIYIYIYIWGDLIINSAKLLIC